MTLSPEARDLLESLLVAEVRAACAAGKGDEPMSAAWTELYSLVVV